MSLVHILLIVLIIFMFVGAPGYGPWQHSYGWGPSGMVGVILVVLLILLLVGRL